MLTQVRTVSTLQGPGLRITRCAIQIFNMLIWVGLPAAIGLQPGSPSLQASAPQTAQESNSLELGKPIERELSGAQSHFYKITVTSGQYLEIIVDQRGVDVVVTMGCLCPAGRVEIDHG
ncbi:MAG: hypothetical protein L0220_18135 [Acidobacteria bacterium]|nr:hypothetical protein [Acidobacteriota bacterium]